MRGATECAKRLKQLVSSLRSKLGKVSLPAVTDPVTQMLLGVLSRDTPEAKANEGLDRLRSIVVDYNELRVIPPLELAEALDDFPEARRKCEDISRSLNAVFAIEHSVSLDRLTQLSRKDVLTYLQRIDGLEAYTIARIRLLGLKQHAIPLDEATWALARREDIVAPRCSLDDAQQFLERQVAQEAALETVALLRKFAWSEFGAAVRKGEVDKITSTPPDRSARNMLQLISTRDSAEPVDIPIEDTVEDFSEVPPAPSRSPGPRTAEEPTAPARARSTKPPRAPASSRKASPAATGKPDRSHAQRAESKAHHGQDKAATSKPTTTKPAGRTRPQAKPKPAAKVQPRKRAARSRSA